MSKNPQSVYITKDGKIWGNQGNAASTNPAEGTAGQQQQGGGGGGTGGSGGKNASIYITNDGKMWGSQGNPSSNNPGGGATGQQQQGVSGGGSGKTSRNQGSPASTNPVGGATGQQQQGGGGGGGGGDAGNAGKNASIYITNDGKIWGSQGNPSSNNTPGGASGQQGQDGGGSGKNPQSVYNMPGKQGPGFIIDRTHQGGAQQPPAGSGQASPAGSHGGSSKDTKGGAAGKPQQHLQGLDGGGAGGGAGKNPQSVNSTPGMQSPQGAGFTDQAYQDGAQPSPAGSSQPSPMGSRGGSSNDAKSVALAPGMQQGTGFYMDRTNQGGTKPSPAGSGQSGRGGSSNDAKSVALAPGMQQGTGFYVDRTNQGGSQPSQAGQGRRGGSSNDDKSVALVPGMQQGTGFYMDRTNQGGSQPSPAGSGQPYPVGGRGGSANEGKSVALAPGMQQGSGFYVDRANQDGSQPSPAGSGQPYPVGGRGGSSNDGKSVALAPGMQQGPGYYMDRGNQGGSQPSPTGGRWGTSNDGKSVALAPGMQQGSGFYIDRANQDGSQPSPVGSGQPYAGRGGSNKETQQTDEFNIVTAVLTPEGPAQDDDGEQFESPAEEFQPRTAKGTSAMKAPSEKPAHSKLDPSKGGASKAKGTRAWSGPMNMNDKETIADEAAPGVPRTGIQFEPNDKVIFKGPFDEIVSSPLIVHNFTRKYCYYKVMVNHPRVYCVRPAKAVVEPNSNVCVPIQLEPLPDYTKQEKQKHKFMILYAESDNCDLEPEEFFKSLRKSAQKAIKMPVVYVPGNRPAAGSAAAVALGLEKDDVDVEMNDNADEKVASANHPPAAGQNNEIRSGTTVSGPAPILHIRPNNAIPFKGPYNKISKSPLCLLNYSKDIVAFKIMTTQPQFYVVRPGFGILKPRQKVNVDCSLDPITDRAVFKKKHKFMIQAAHAPSADVNLEQFWKDVKESETQVTKLKVMFEVSPDGSGVPLLASSSTPSTHSKPHSKSRRGGKGKADPAAVQSAMRKLDLPPVLKVEPEKEVIFKGPFNGTQTKPLKLTNLTSNPVMFKILTTAPKYYRIKNKMGTLNANETATAILQLEGVKDVALAKKEAKHKFMILAAVPDKPVKDVARFWKTAPESTQSFKIKAVLDETGAGAPASSSPPKEAAKEAISLEPEKEIVFRGPFTDIVTSVLCVFNNTDMFMYYKVMVSNQKPFCVRPKHGIITPRGMAVLAIMLEAQEEIKDIEKEKNKFQVLYAEADTNNVSPDDFWKELDKQPHKSMKLRATFCAD